jgi:putative tryptophan/tyrosine transport system substrate-binding protein
MRRRTIVLGGAASAMLAAAGVRSQESGRVYRIGVLSPGSALTTGPYLDAFRELLAKHGFVEGRNLRIVSRVPVGGSQSALRMAEELAADKPDAMFACTTTLASATRAATNSIPVVFAWVGDPVRSSIVADYAKPGGNITGVSNRYFELTAKRLELVRELLPDATRVAMLTAFQEPVIEEGVKVAHRAAEALGIRIIYKIAGFDWRAGIDAAVQEGAQAISLLFPFFALGMRFTAEQVVQMVAERRIPAIFHDSETVEIGGLMSYGTNLVDDVRRGANLLVRVLRGERPGDLAVDQTGRFELVINLKTARAIGLKVPQSLLLRADRVIE